MFLAEEKKTGVPSHQQVVQAPVLYQSNLARVYGLRQVAIPMQDVQCLSLTASTSLLWLHS